jgi:hypothetical protein
VTGGDEYELTGDDTEYHSDPVTKQNRQVSIFKVAVKILSNDFWTPTLLLCFLRKNYVCWLYEDILIY